MIQRLVDYLNPINKLGKPEYSALFPFVATIIIYLLSEGFSYLIARNPMIVSDYVIFLSAALIIYFSFRDGILGGFIATFMTIQYYFYIIYSRHYRPDQARAGLETTLILALIYFALAAIIGWLKQTIDRLIEGEADGKRRLEVIIQQLPVGVIITNEKGRITQTNKQVENLLGKPVSLTGSPVLQSLESGKSVIDKEFTLKREGLRERTLQISASPIKNSEGKIIAAASIISDITPQKELDKRKDDFVNMASHELKTPLTSLKLYQDSLNLIVKKYKDPGANKLLTNIKYQTDRLGRLINDLLDVSKLQTGKLAFVKEEFAVDALIKESIEGLKAAAKDRKIVFRGPSVKIYADRFRISQVITNLVTNAIKYSPKGTDIIIRTKKDRGLAIISVQDFGIGIPKDQQKKIFDRLYQVGDETPNAPSGFGMGLFIAREIVKRHRGSIWVESEKGRGSTFFISLPLAKKNNNPLQKQP